MSFVASAGRVRVGDEPQVVRFPGVTVELFAGWTVTKYDGGGAVLAAGPHSAEDIASARSLGYEGTDAEVMAAATRDHDLCHQVAAFVALGRPCPVLADVAAGGSGRIPGGREVEAAILGLQAHLNRYLRPALMRAANPEA